MQVESGRWSPREGHAGQVAAVETAPASGGPVAVERAKPGWKHPGVIVFAMLALGMALFVAAAISREDAEPDLVRVTGTDVAGTAQPLPQPVVPAPTSAPVAAAPGTSPVVAGQGGNASAPLARAQPVPGEIEEDVVVSPADGVYVGASASQGAGSVAAIDSPAATPGVGMTEAELREWRRGNAESMRVLERTTPEVAGGEPSTPASVQPAPSR